ncbi:MAG: HEAT repeat domain-containing protein [Thermodesulfobacteriota bacterium]|nr:HEAT repeat domain-containing protein [Thermodesulfobacteriota bacterium]
MSKNMMSEKVILDKLLENVESEGFKRIELPQDKKLDIPFILVKFGNIFLLIAVKVGYSDVSLSDSYWRWSEQNLIEALKPFEEQGHTRATLVTNQKVPCELLSLHVYYVNQFDTSEITKIVKNDIDMIQQIFKESYQALFSRTPDKKLGDLQKVVQFIRLLDKKKLEKLIKYFEGSTSQQIRGELCYLLGRWGKIEIIPTLLDFLKDKNEYVCSEASTALLHLWERPDIRLSLLHLLKSEDENVRSQAADTLSQIKGIIDKRDEEELILQENAYLAMEETLIKKYPGQFAGFFGGELIEVRQNEDELMHAVVEKVGNVRYYIRRISRDLPKVSPPKPRK